MFVNLLQNTLVGQNITTTSLRPSLGNGVHRRKGIHQVKSQKYCYHHYFLFDICCLQMIHINHTNIILQLLGFKNMEDQV